MKRLTRAVLLMGSLSLVLLPFSAFSIDRYGTGGGPTITEPMPERSIIIIGHQHEGKFVTKIEPFNKLRLGRFTRLSWENNAEVPVRIKLGAGKECRELANVEFHTIGSRFFSGCYITKTPLPAGGVLQTNLNEQGQYPFEVEYVGEKAKESGVIIVY